MKIKNQLVLNEQFIEAFTDLMVLSMPAKQCLEVSSSIEELASHHNVLVRTRRAIADKYCKKDEEGKPIEVDGNITFDTPDLKSKCFEELQEIYDEDIDLPITNRIKIKATEVMTPLKIKLLKDIIDIID